jgi:hypothetical protein
MIHRRSLITGLVSLPFIPAWMRASTANACQNPANSVKKSRVFAHRGEIVTCEGGHEIAYFNREVMYGETWDDTALVGWGPRNTKPERGTISQPCLCGKDYFRGTHLHFHEGWR